MAYVARDGAVAARPFSLVAALWGALDVVDAFFRTLLVEGHADAYARRTTTARAPTPEPLAATTPRGAQRPPRSVAAGASLLYSRPLKGTGPGASGWARARGRRPRSESCVQQLRQHSSAFLR